MIIPEELSKVERMAMPTTGLPQDNNHDPSNIIKYNGRYYFWYTDHIAGQPYNHFDHCRIMMTTSPDGIKWDKGIVALVPSETGWDNGGVLTANVFKYNDKYYMWYIGVGRNYNNEPRNCNIAVADSPDGPFTRLGDNPILFHGKPGSWNDSSVDDVSTIYFNGKWMTYFKGMTYAKDDGDFSMLGVAFSETPFGPYKYYEGNPIIRGHAFSVWTYKNGVLLLSGLKDKENEGYMYRGNWEDPNGHQYLYFSTDGLNFKPVAEFENRASGIYIPEGNDGEWIGNYWGVSVKSRNGHSGRYIEKFGFKVNE